MVMPNALVGESGPGAAGGVQQANRRVVAAAKRLGVAGQVGLLAFAMVIALAGAWWHTGEFAALWLTADQRARLAFERRDFAGAAELFENPEWSGVAAYSAGHYLDAAAQFGRTPTAVGSFNRGDALLKGREYERAIDAFEQALAQDPDMEIAQRNLALARYILEYLEDLREQSDTGDENELSADELEFDNKRNRGREVVFTNTSQLEAKSAEQWMRSVDTRMSDYLRTRFLVESARREAQ